MELGSAIRIEAQTKKWDDDSEDYVLFDTTPVPTVTVTDQDGTVKVDAQDMTNFATGKYKYIVQSETDWTAGYYTVQVNASDGTYSDVTVRPTVFKLE